MPVARTNGMRSTERRAIGRRRRRRQAVCPVVLTSTTAGRAAARAPVDRRAGSVSLQSGPLAAAAAESPVLISATTDLVEMRLFHVRHDPLRDYERRKCGTVEGHSRGHQ